VNSQSSTPSEEFFSGIRAQLPILLGVAPFGMIFGALAISAGIPPLQAQGFSLFIFAGSSQFIAVGLVGEGAPLLVIVLTIFVVNLRHLLYSANLAIHFERLSRPWKIVLSWLLTDEAFAVAALRYRRRDTASAHWFTLGTGIVLWATWQASTALGILLGAGIPATWSLDFALPLTFLALLAPILTDRPTWLAALSAGLFAVLLNGLPYKLGLLLGSGLGVVFGLAADLILTTREQEPA
jgi:4-azaleucine resistance transporter AzlC